MKNVVLCVTVLLASISQGLLGQVGTGPKLRVAVMDLREDAFSATQEYGPTSTTSTIEIPPPAGFALGLTEMLTTALVETGRFVVVERAKLQEVLDEQDFGASGRVTQQTAARQGQMLGVQALITGGITEYNYTSSSLGGNVSMFNRVSASAQQLKAMVALDMRLINAETGEIIASKRGDGSATARTVSAQATINDKEFSSAVAASTPLGKATREAIEEIVEAIVEELAGMRWSGRVIDVRDNLVYINAGSDAGVEQGMEFEVYEEQKALIDPETGLNLGAPERFIGSIRVTQVNERFSVAEVAAGGGFARNNVVRFAGQAGKP
ncbi:MAG: hypothetical protein IID05_00795 [Gemmatimonadetes bacterium]|nr:hypothetical protein [Gemmatimonadota bacterium]